MKSSLTNVHSTATQTYHNAAKNTVRKGGFAASNGFIASNNLSRRNCVLSPCVTAGNPPCISPHQTNYLPTPLFTANSNHKPTNLPHTADTTAADSLVPSTSYLNMAESNSVFVHPDHLLAPEAVNGGLNGLFPLNFVYKNIREELLKTGNVSCNSPNICSRWKVFGAFFS